MSFILQPGPGHIEHTMIRCLVKLIWSPFMETILPIYNFRSDTAKKSAKQVSDHHKGFTLMKIMRQSLTKELLIPYVREGLSAENGEAQLSVDGFLEYMKNVKSENYSFIFNLVLFGMIPLFMYRTGVRAGNIELMDTGRAYFGPLFLLLNHRSYSQVLIYNEIINLSAPVSVRKFLNKTKSFNTSGLPFTGEGGDYKLEWVNGCVQFWQTVHGNIDNWKAGV